MVVSNEPGYYQDGEFGVRIENLLEIQGYNSEWKESCERESAGKQFLKFCTLTLVPIQQNLIDIKLLTEKELDWLDAYHKVIFQKISPLIEPNSLAMNWLKKSCSEINRTTS